MEGTTDMMISIGKFQEICESLSPKCIVFSSSNQEKDNSASGRSVSLDVKFDNIVISCSPNVVLLTRDDKSAFMKFEQIREVEMKDKSVLGNVFSLLCSEKSVIRCYTIIVR